MNCHIIPRTTLKEFSEDKKYVKYIDNSFEIKKEEIKTASTIEDFYSIEKENELARDYETKYGLIKKKIKDQVSNNKPYIRLTKEEYIMLIKYDTIQWRRTKYNIDNQLENLEKIGEEFINIIKMQDDDKNKLKEELKEKSKNFDSNLIVDISEEDFEPGGFIHKQLNFYTPVIIVNNSEINFPLHDKVNTILKNDRTYIEGFPIAAVSPITNRIIFKQVLRKNGVKWSENHVKIPIEMTSKQETKSLIKVYVLGTANRVYLDETNKEFVTEIYKSKKSLPAK